MAGHKWDKAGTTGTYSINREVVCPWCGEITLLTRTAAHAWEWYDVLTGHATSLTCPHCEAVFLIRLAGQVAVETKRREDDV